MVLQELLPRDKAQTGISTGDTRKHFARNMLVSIIFLVFNTATSLYIVPFQIRFLGIANYGMVTLALSFNAYLQILTIMITSSSGRFVATHVARDELEKAKGFLTTQLVAALWLVVGLLPICALFAYLAPYWINVPKGEATNTRLLFLLVFVAFSLTTPVAVLGVCTFIRQRFDLSRAVEIANQVFRYTTWIVFFAVFTPSLWHIGLGYLVGTTAALGITLVLFRRLTPELGPSLRGFDLAKFRETSAMGAWRIVYQLGTVLSFSISILVVNKMLGPASAGRFGTVLLLAQTVISVGTPIGNMIQPALIAFHARGEHADLIRVAAKSVKLQSLMMAIPIAVLCGFSTSFLKWWLGPEFGVLSPLLWVTTGSLVWILGVVPLTCVFIALNKLALPAIATVGSGLLNLFLAVGLVKYAGLGLMGVAIATTIGGITNFLVFSPVYTSRLLKTSYWAFYKPLLPSAFVFAGTAVAGSALARAVELNTFLKLFGAGMALITSASLITYAVALGRDDRALVRQLLKFRKTKATDGR